MLGHTIRLHSLAFKGSGEEKKSEHGGSNLKVSTPHGGRNQYISPSSSNLLLQSRQKLLGG